jgi:hypothetical protein
VPGFLRWLDTPAGRVPVISTQLAMRDTLGAWQARWGIGRMSYLVPPGLYAIGAPGPGTPVVVTANYKMSYDSVRWELAGRDIWLLVLETHGINVWCAAGKGTFGTDEIVKRVGLTSLSRIVNHRTLLLPMLGAPGVAAHLVRQRTGFKVRYATIRAADLPAYLDNGMIATSAMRQLTFTTVERLVLTPIELVAACKWGLPVMALIVLAAGFSDGAFSPERAVPAAIAWGATIATGAVGAPLLLPWLPGRSFAVKGASLGLLLAALLVWSGRGMVSLHEVAALFFITPAVCSFLALTFTGSTPFTSRSGVKKEMRVALPVMTAALVAGLTSWLFGSFLLS